MGRQQNRQQARPDQRKQGRSLKGHVGSMNARILFCNRSVSSEAQQPQHNPAAEEKRCQGTPPSDRRAILLDC